MSRGQPLASAVTARLWVQPDDEKLLQFEAYLYILLRKRAITERDLAELDSCVFAYKTLVVAVITAWNDAQVNPKKKLSMNTPNFLGCTLLTMNIDAIY